MLPIMSIRQWMQLSEKLLTQSKIASAHLDVLILLEDALNEDRSWILAHQDEALADKTALNLNDQIKRRSAHEPLAYIRGKSEFYGREFIVSPATLQPRPETETMITLVKSLGLQANTNIADIGTGSGALAITAKLEMPDVEMYATEVQADALEIAKLNANNLKADVSFYAGNLIEPISKLNPAVIMANLPYVPDAHTINQAAMHEPAIAIFGGHDGLDLYRLLISQIKELNQKPKHVLTESLPFQHLDLQKLMQNSGYTLQQTDDFIQVYVLL